MLGRVLVYLLPEAGHLDVAEAYTGPKRPGEMSIRPAGLVDRVNGAAAFTRRTSDSELRAGEFWNAGGVGP